MNISPSKSGWLKRRWMWLAGGAGGLVVLALGVSGAGLGEKGDAQAALFPVRRGPLEISVTEAGTINNREKVAVRCQVEGRTTLLSLVPEGTRVQEGDLLVELDASGLIEQKTQQGITVLNAEAAFIRARENLAVTRSQSESDIDKADLAYRFSKTDLQKYNEGEYPQQLQQAENEITLAREELQRAQDRLDWSRQLAEEGYITRTDLQADELAFKRAELAVALAQSKLNLLTQYTHQRDLAQLESDVEQARMALDRVKRKAAADLVQAEAELTAKQSELTRQQDKLKKLDEQIALCTIRAPVAGMVVYATSGQGGWRGNAEPLEAGQQVTERQELIHLPTTASMMVETKIHESSLQKVRLGLPVRVAVDALPNQTFWGRVTKIAPMPDATSAWMNPDLKVYPTEIQLDGDGSALRPGMSCRATIVVQQHNDALSVPVQAVTRINGQPVVYTPSPAGPQARPVTIGLDNNRMVHILDGVQAGEPVLLAPPLSPASTANEALAEMPPPTTAPAEVAAVEAPAEPAETPALPSWLDPEKLRTMTNEQRMQFFANLTDEQRAELQKLRGQAGGRGGPGGGGRRPGGQ